jgi:hypothetical protein
LQKRKNIQISIARFTRWSRKAWAVFASLHREVQIGKLKISVINKSFNKNIVDKLSSPMLISDDYSDPDLLSVDEILNAFGMINISENQLVTVLANNKKTYTNSLKKYFTQKVLINFLGNF